MNQTTCHVLCSASVWSDFPFLHTSSLFKHFFLFSAHTTLCRHQIISSFCFSQKWLSQQSELCCERNYLYTQVAQILQSCHDQTVINVCSRTPVTASCVYRSDFLSLVGTWRAGRGRSWPHVFAIWGVFCQMPYICFVIFELVFLHPPPPPTLCVAPSFFLCCFLVFFLSLYTTPWGREKWWKKKKVRTWIRKRGHVLFFPVQ